MLMKVIYKVDRSSKVPMIARNNMKLEEWTKQARFIATTKQDTSTGIYICDVHARLLMQDDHISWEKEHMQTRVSNI